MKSRPLGVSELDVRDTSARCLKAIRLAEDLALCLFVLGLHYAEDNQSSKRVRDLLVRPLLRYLSTYAPHMSTHQLKPSPVGSECTTHHPQACSTTPST